jgi:hypothetical protein
LAAVAVAVAVVGMEPAHNNSTKNLLLLAFDNPECAK